MAELDPMLVPITHPQDGVEETAIASVHYLSVAPNSEQSQGTDQPAPALGETEQATEELSRARRLWQVVKRTGQTAIIGAEVLPANEALRLAAFTAGEVYSHNPLMGALTFGGSTLLIEGSAALATASVLSSDNSLKAISWLKEKLTKLGYKDDGKEASKSTKFWSTVMGGSAIGMAVNQFGGEPKTIEENRRFGLKASVGLGLGCAAVGAMGSEAVDFTFDHPVNVGIGAAALAVTFAGKKVKEAIKGKPEAAPDAVKWLDTDKHGYKYGVAEGEDILEQAAQLEQDVWDEEGFGKLADEGYDKYIENSRTLVAYKGKKIIGVNRMFNGENGTMPPFITEMPYDDDAVRKQMIDMVQDGELEELGTVAVPDEYRGERVNLHLWRAAYRDALERGVTHWGIIMEPERVAKMNKYQGFTFEQVGETVQYQGGECAAHVMKFSNTIDNMRHGIRKHPIQFGKIWYWMEKDALKP